MQDKSRNIAIVGGSTTGFFSAHLLARSGHNVSLFEAAPRIEPSPRTLIVTDYLRRVLGPLAEEAVVNTIDRFELYADGRVASISLKRPDLMIERSSLLHKLAETARASGTRVFCDHRFLGFRPNGKGLDLTLATNSHKVDISAEIVIGADGASSAVASSAGLPGGKKVPLRQAVVELPGDMSPHTTRVWFLPEETPYFYWLIPFSRRQGVVGLIGEDPVKTEDSLNRFLKKKGFSPLDFQDASILSYDRWIPNHRKIGNGHVYLVGDAAGHVKMSTVGGIVTGFRGALAVKKRISEENAVGEQCRLWLELTRHLLIRRVLHNFTQEDYVRFLNMLSPATHESLGSMTRDETGKLLFHVFLKSPTFLLLGLRSLLLGRKERSFNYSEILDFSLHSK